MEKCKSTITAGVLIIMVILVSGCTDQAKKKQAMVEKWNHNKSAANIPVASGLIDSGDIKQAKSVLQKCIADEPGLYSGHLLMGRVHYLEGQLEKAKDSLHTAVKLNDQCDQGWYWLGEVERADGDFKAAAKHYSKALEIEPLKAEYSISLAKAYADGGDYEKSLELLDKKISSASNDVSLVKAKADILIQCGRKDEVVKTYEKSLLLNGGSTELVESLGYCYFMEKEWDKAKEMFEILVKSGPAGKQNEYLQKLSTCCMNTGEYDSALGYFDKMDSHCKDDADFWLESGQAALGSQQGRRVVFCANRALFLKPGWGDARVLLGCGEYLNGDYEKALTTFTKVPGEMKDSNLVRMMTQKCKEKITENENNNELSKDTNQLANDFRVSMLMNSELE